MLKETQKAKIERLEQLLLSANETIERQNKQIDELTKEIKALEKSNEEDLREAYRESAKLELQISANEREYNRHIKELEKYYNSKLNNKNSVQELKINDSNELEQLQKENDELRKEIEQLKREQYKYETKKKLHEEIETLKKNNEDDLQKAYEEVARLELKIKEKDSQYNDNLKKLENYYIQKLKMNDNIELEQLQKENAELKKKLNAGRKEKFSAEQQKQIKQLRADNKSMQEIANILNCSKATVFNYLKKFNNK